MPNDMPFQPHLGVQNANGRIDASQMQFTEPQQPPTALDALLALASMAPWTAGLGAAGAGFGAALGGGSLVRNGIARTLGRDAYTTFADDLIDGAKVIGYGGGAMGAFGAGKDLMNGLNSRDDNIKMQSQMPPMPQYPRR